MDTKKQIIMKQIVLCLLLALSFTMVYGKKSTVNIKGYYVTRYVKSEMQDYYVQKVRRAEGKSHKTYIDFMALSYFIPIQIGGDTILSKQSIPEKIIIYNDSSKDSIYFLPKAKSYEEYFYRIFKKNIDLTKEICLFSDLAKSYPYYLSQLSEKYIYKCIYLEGEAFFSVLENTEPNRYNAELGGETINLKSPFFTVFFMTNIKKYTPFVNIPGLEQWYPYLNK